MSRENVELVRRIYEAAARRDDEIPFEFYADDIVWDMSNARRSALYIKPVYEGHEGVRQAWRESLAAFGEVDFEVEELMDAGDQVMAVLRERVVGRASGAPVETGHVVVWTLADGKVTRLQVFDDRLEALEAVGLQEQAMSQENVEIVRRWVAAWNAGDMEVVRELHDPDVVMVVERDWPEPGPFVGRDAMMRHLRQARDAFESDSLEFLSDFVAVGDRVIVRVAWHGVGSGPQSDMGWTNVFTIREGRVLTVEYFWDHAEALEAVGLSE